LQDGAIEENFWKSEILRDVVWIEVMESYHCFAMECAAPHWHGICEVNNIGVKLSS
jgi:hypothetical protein